MSPAVALDSGQEGRPDSVRTKLIYEWDAQRYLRSLPLEHFMESTTQSKQREITLESLALVRAVRPEFQVFSELLIQYPLPGENPDKPKRVVPDNMVIVHSEPIDALGSFMTPLQPVRPILVLEYVSASNPRKDYDDNFKKYERELRVPYYLLFSPDEDGLTVFHLVGGKYLPLTPNAADRLAIPELELEVAILDGWVRYWHRGELLPLPGDLLNELNAEKSARLAAERATAVERTARVAAERAQAVAEAELAKLREDLGRSTP